MCGIAGLLDARLPSTEVLQRFGSQMADALVHRCPDDGGVWVDASQGVVLANRRLAIVGLGAQGHQPMSCASGRWTVTFNGEIYNFAALAKALAAEGVGLRGCSDTEALVEAVDHFGLLEALERCEGMFAFAAWDAKLRELHLVRDRLGEKPLYFGWVGKRFAFASELKSLRRLPDFDAHLDRNAMALFLRYNCIPAPSTAYVGITKAFPGELLTLRAGARVGEEPVSRRYWNASEVVDRSRAELLALADEELVERLRVTLSGAVADRMLADVPLGAFLSGGVDSSLVVALMQEHSATPVKTFTVGFADRAYDESGDAARVAAHIGTDHTTLDLSDREAMEVVEELPYIWDEPFADSSQIPTLLVSRLAREHVTVVLSGDGGDELFGGYNRHLWLERLWRRSSFLPRGASRALRAAALAVPPQVFESLERLEFAVPKSWRLRIPATKFAKAARVIGAPDLESAYATVVTHWEEPEIGRASCRERVLCVV